MVPSQNDLQLGWCKWSGFTPQHSLGIYRKRTDFSVLAEVSFVCWAYVGPVVQKDLQIQIAFYVQIQSHFLWLVLHHVFELCLLSNQWWASYTDHWTQESLSNVPEFSLGTKVHLCLLPDSLWLRDVTPITEKHLLTNPLKPCNRIDCIMESLWAAAWVGGAPRSQLPRGTQGYHTLGFQGTSVTLEKLSKLQIIECIS